MKHFIGMAGLHGYLPQTCDVYDSVRDAADSLAAIHELGKRRTRKLAHDRYIELNLHDSPLNQGDGNEYAEIVECDCGTPEVHSDSTL
jgi:hypothetical protein